MKWFTLPGLLAAALFSAVVVIPFAPFTRHDPRPFVLEARVTASVAGNVKIYYDIGGGYNEQHSAELRLPAARVAQDLRFPLPAGTYHSLRIDPIDQAGEVTIAGSLRLASAHGRVVGTVAPAELEPLNQIAARRVIAGQLEVVTTNPAEDPQLRVTFATPIVAEITVPDAMRDRAPAAFGVFVALGLLLYGADRSRPFRAGATTCRDWLRARPARAVLVAAAASVVLSAYPVIFLGQSLVSPNFGTALLYEKYPTVPGYESVEESSTNGTDVGAAMWQHVPYSFMQRRALAQGELPWWNRYTLTGVPLLGQGQSMFGDPVHFLLLLAGAKSWAWDAKLLIAKWLFAAGVGLIVLALRAGLRDHGTTGQQDQGETGLADNGTTGQQDEFPDRPPNSVVRSPVVRSPVVRGSVVRSPVVRGPVVSCPVVLSSLLVAASAPFIGFYVFRINHPAVFSVGYAPWVLYAWMRFAAAVDRRSAVLWAAGLFVANWSLLNSGTAKEASVLLLQMNATGAALLLAGHRSVRERIRRLLGAAWTGALLLLMTAPMWDTFLTSLRHAFTGSTHLVVDQIQPSLLLGAFDELFFRPLSKGEIVFDPSLNFFLLLGVIYFFVTLRVHLADRRLVVLLMAGAASAAVVFGVVPLQALVHLPLIGKIGHVENCFLCGLLVMGAALAGVGLQTALGRLRTTEGARDLVVGGLGLAAIVAAWIGYWHAAHRSVYGPGVTFSAIASGQILPVATFIWGSLASLLLASAVLATVTRRSLVRGAFGPAGVLVVLLCFGVLHWRHGLHVMSVGFESYVVRPPARAPFDGRSPALEQVRARHAREPGRIFGMNANVTPGWNAAYGLEAVHGPDALQAKWLRELIDVSPVKWNSAWRLYLASPDVAQGRPFLDVLNVRHYLDLATNPPLRDASLQRVASADLEVYESRTAWPRAFFADAVVGYAEPGELMKRMLASEGRPFAAVHRDDLAANRTLAGLSREAGATRILPGTNYQLESNSTSFEVHATGPGIAVLHEAAWPESFRAFVDGQRAPIIRVNHAFKGVLIDRAGQHRITFRYWPRNLTRDLIMAGAGLGLGLLSLGWAWRGRREATAQPTLASQPASAAAASPA